MPVSFAIPHWSGWISGESNPECRDIPHITVTPAPDVKTIPPMLRRRLNMLGRACASEVLKYIAPGSDIPIVYASQHGDIERTYSVLSELLHEESVSPMQFSLAVHNAIGGVLSIHTKNHSNINALSAGKTTMVPAILEAAGMLADGAEVVACVICDVPLPQVYSDEHSQPQKPYAVSFLISAEDANYTLERTSAIADAPYQPPIQLIEFLGSGRSEFEMIHNGSIWRLTRSPE